MPVTMHSNDTKYTLISLILAMGATICIVAISLNVVACQRAMFESRVECAKLPDRSVPDCRELIHN